MIMRFVMATILTLFFVALLGTAEVSLPEEPVERPTGCAE